MPTATQSAFTKPDSTKPFVCAHLFLACACHAPTCACPSCAHARHLPARALPIPARALCLRVATMLVFLDTVAVGILLWRNISLARLFKGAPMHRRENLAMLATVVISILRVIRPQTLCLSVSCFYLHAPCSVLPQRASYCHTPTTGQAYTHTHAHQYTHTDTDTKTHAQRHAQRHIAHA